VKINSFKSLRAKHLRLGRRGERFAARLLRHQNYEILVRNYNSPRGEIDIVARDGKTVVFVEVKTRYYTTKNRPAAGLRLEQIKRISRAGLYYINSLQHENVLYRFDLIEIICNRWDIIEAYHWDDHWTPSEHYSKRL
jgi:putative endonuclease